MNQHHENFSKLTAKQTRCAILLASGLTGRGAASELGVSPQTVSVWNRMVEFRSLVARLLDETTAEANLALAASRLKAIERIHELLGSTNPSVALRACEAVLRLAPAASAYKINQEEEDFFLGSLEALSKSMQQPN